MTRTTPTDTLINALLLGTVSVWLLVKKRV